MNPPESQGEDYDRGYAAGYHDRSIQQLVIDISQVRNLRPEDIDYLSDLCTKSPFSVVK